MKMLAIVLTLCLAGCVSEAHKPTIPPLVLRVFKAPEPVKVYVTLPDELTADCIEVEKSKDPLVNFEEEATRLANERKKANDECTGRMRQIRNKQGKPVK